MIDASMRYSANDRYMLFSYLISTSLLIISTGGLLTFESSDVVFLQRMVV